MSEVERRLIFHGLGDGGAQGSGVLPSSVHFPAVPNFHNQDPRSGIVNFVKNPIIAHANPVAFFTFQFLRSGRMRVVGQGAQVRRKTIPNLFGELAELAGCPGAEINRVGHAGEL